MNKRSLMIVAGVVGVIAIGAVGYMTVNNTASKNQGVPAVEASNPPQNPQNVTVASSTYSKFAVLKGEEYDKALLADMIVHHESALSMAELAYTAAQRQEIKDMAATINSAQGQEVATMVELQKKWGYPVTSGHNMDNMSATDSSMAGMDKMAEAYNQLSSAKGEEFDKKFLEVMIEHHQQAVDMASPGASNALRTEVKQLAQSIASAETAEIAQMKQWQKAWGYTNASSSQTQ